MEMFNRISAKFRPNEAIQVQELINEDDLEDDHYLKTASANRSRTDTLFLVIHGVALIILAIVLGCTLMDGDIDRLRQGYDMCGNVCGKNNNFNIENQLTCKAMDMTNKPYLYINGNHRTCVESCDSNATLISSTNRCISNRADAESEDKLEEYIQGFAKSLHKCSNEIVYLAGIALGFAFVVLLLLRYFTAVFVWFIMFGMLMVFAGWAAFYGNIATTTYSADERDTAIRATIFWSIMVITLLSVIIILRKRIQLVIQLFKEAGNSIMIMPLLIFEPILTFVSLAVIWSAWVYFSLWIESAGNPTETFETVTFVRTGFMTLADLYNIFVMLWMVQFVCYCQNMIVAGAVSTLYFARNKSKLGSPIYSSARNMIKYHLGTISVASVIIAIVQFVKILVLSLRRVLRYATCITYCLNYVEQWMRYYTKNACIITAMHGYQYREAGSRAFKLIVNNVVQIITINAVSDWVLVLAKLLVAAATMGCGLLLIKDKSIMGYEWPILAVIGFMTYMIAHCFFSVYEVAVDTIFICFCEDLEVNDGISRPYFMSHELMDFVEKSKTIITVKTNSAIISA